ncbi:hypothetical protein C6Q19_05455, partial [Burkholderia cenocepacia]
VVPMPEVNSSPRKLTAPQGLYETVSKPRRVAFVIGWRYGCRVSSREGGPGSATVELPHSKELL